MSRTGRAWVERTCIVVLFAAACASPSSQMGTAALSPPPSSDATWLIDASINSRVIKGFPHFTKMTLVKVVPAAAQRFSSEIDAVFSDARLRDEIARRIDGSLGDADRQAARQAMSEQEYVHVVQRLLDLGQPVELHVLDRPTPVRARALFDAMRPAGDADRLARAPITAALQIARAALAADDPRQQELAAMAAELPSVPRDLEQHAFIERMRGLNDADVVPVLDCFEAGPCALAERAVVAAHLGAADALTAELIAMLRAQPVVGVSR